MKSRGVESSPIVKSKKKPTSVVGTVDFESGGWWFESKSSHK
jgi:hypothetical protein